MTGPSRNHQLDALEASSPNEATDSGWSPPQVEPNLNDEDRRPWEGFLVGVFFGALGLFALWRLIDAVWQMVTFP